MKPVRLWVVAAGLVAYGAAVAVVGSATAGAGDAGRPASVGPDALVIMNYDRTGPVDASARLDVTYHGFPGDYLAAVDHCNDLGGEPISYSWHPTAADELVCESVDH